MDPCSACGVAAWLAERMQYESHVKLHRVEEARGVWAIGTDFVIRELPPEGPSNFSNGDNEVACLRFVKDHTTIPVPTVVKDWTDQDGTYFQMQERIHGETLEDAWPTLSMQEKGQIADEVAMCLLQLRKFQSSTMSSFNGRSSLSNYLFFDNSRLHGPFVSDDAFYDDLLNDFDLSAEERQDLRARSPACQPYTLTLGALTISDFVVKSGHLVAIMSWETAGYFPIWWEYVRASATHGPEDTEWKGMLQERMEKFPGAHEFWRELHSPQNLDKLGFNGKVLAAALGQTTGRW